MHEKWNTYRRVPYFAICFILGELIVVNQGVDVLEICPRGNNKCSYYYIFVFMINVYIHAIIVLTRKPLILV